MVFNLRTFSFTESVEDNPTPTQSFSLKEIRVATDNFSSNNIMGDFWRGKVYRGHWADGSLVAIKRASIVSQQSEKEFEAEVQVGSMVSTHPNVLRLRGFCRTKKELLLVYPFMINNSVVYNLRERLDRFARPLDWTARKRIALGAARGLAHLHNQGNIKINHGGICASNILLNANFEAVIGGFADAAIMHERNVEEGTIEWSKSKPRRGTAVSFSSPVEENSADSGSDSQTYHRYEDVYVNTPICGTPGYIAPKYFYTQKCTLKSDVFAYGKMILELISGQPIYGLHVLADDENLSLDEWIGDFMNKNELGRVIDHNLQGNYVEEEVEQLVRLALLCADGDPSVRPKMSEVVTMIENQMLGQDSSSRSNWSGSEYDSTPYYSFPPSPSPSLEIR